MKTVNDSELESALTNVANVIRSKIGASTTMTFPDGFVKAISSITNCVLSFSSVYPSSIRQICSVSSDYDGLSYIQVDGDENLNELYIRNGTTIFEVEGISDGGLAKIAEKTIQKICSPTSIIRSWTFEKCFSLIEVSLPSCLYIGSNAFYNCNSLATLYAPLCSEIGSNAFFRCYSLTDCILPSCKAIRDRAFFRASSIISAYIPECLTVEYGAFYACTSLENVSFSKCEVIGAYAFCWTGISSSILSMSACTSIGAYAFRYSDITSVYLPNCTYLGLGVFQSCKMTEIDLPLCESISPLGESLYDDYGTFQNCTSLVSVSIPACKYVGLKAFCCCDSLSNVYMPLCQTIDVYAFAGCNLENLTAPECTYIGSSAFGGATIENISIENCKYIDTAAFEQATIYSISLPNCLRIHDEAFISCTSLVAAYFLGSTVPILDSADVFYNTPIDNGSGYIYVSPSLYYDYISAPCWSYYASKIVSYTDSSS